MHLIDVIASRSPSVIIDARMQKHRMTPDLRGIARVTVSVGPKFEVGLSRDIDIETHPGETGVIVAGGATRPADGQARDFGSAGRKRSVSSNGDSIWHTPVDIGTRVDKGLQLRSLGGIPVLAPMDGALRGIARDGLRVPSGDKLLEIDPRTLGLLDGIDERGRNLASSVVLAIRQTIQADRRVDCVSANV